MLYGEIAALSNKNGYCFASNEYFANLYKINISIISLGISLLNKSHYINNKIIYKKDTKQIIARHLYIINSDKHQNINLDNNKITPNYYAIIPANIRYDSNLQPNAKLLCGELNALSNKYGYCKVTNDYFVKLFNSSKRTIINRINTLIKNNYIKTEIIKSPNSKQILEIRIFITSEIPSEKIQIDNITSFNNVVGKPDYISKQNFEIIEKIIIHLNNILGTNYKLISKETTKLINEKLNEGFTLENFIKVIDKKHNQ